MTSFSRACPRSRWSSGDSGRPGKRRGTNGARPRCRVSCRPSWPTPRSPSTPPTRSRRCCGWWPSRHASSWAPSAAWRRWPQKASLGAAEAASYSDDRRWTEFAAVARPVRDLPAHPPARRLSEDRRRGSRGPASIPLRAWAIDPPKGWLAASLTALDGSELGAIQLFDKQDGAFTETTRPPSSISPRWRRRPSSGHGSTRSEASRTRPGRARARASR